jgi:hypothetical protein
MKNYKRINNITGWVVFSIAAYVYLSTIEATASLWDCGEFIATAFKLEVGHPPGAPFFLLLARFFTLLTGNPELAARMVNSMSALASAFTILFLFWTITHLARKILGKQEDLTGGQVIAIMLSGIIGALAYTFSDSFWFSAVEGEVYATSSLFTAVVFWAILKWEESNDPRHAERWMILIAYLVGLSIGVHLLNLLAIPAIVLVYYHKKFTPTPKGIIISLAISFVILVLIMYGIIQGLFKVSSQFELFMVNTLGLPYNSGLALHMVLLAASLVLGILYVLKNKDLKRSLIFTSTAVVLSGMPFMSSSIFLDLIIAALLVWAVVILGKKNQRFLLTLLTSLTMILIGYSSFALILIRANADPPLNENKPDNVFSFLSYIDREQYGTRPLFFGQYYNTPVTGIKNGKPTYIRKNGKYIVSQYSASYEYDSRATTIFPRMYSSQPDHIRVYKQWGHIKGRPLEVTDRDGKKKTIMIPTFGENLRYFFSYQLGFMYLRYFMWNFSGRQNDIQGLGGPLEGNWISGIPFIDKNRVGPSDNLPAKFAQNKGRNVYYLLPFLLGLLGLFFHWKKHPQDFLVVLLLFFMTGIAIVIYLNQTPNQPRERDYAYVGSFYAYSIWIGLGVMGLFYLLKKVLSEKISALLAGLLTIGIPAIMAQQNWDDHDRSGRYTARDLAYDYLNTCEKDAILFTNGDNDTFPLWYVQEVEGVRTDVRVVNLMLFNTDWYIDQMKKKVYDSDPLPLTLPRNKYLDGTNNQVYMIDNKKIKGYLDLRTAIDFLASDKKGTKLQLQDGRSIDFLPAKRFSIPVDSATVVANGTVDPALADEIVPQLRINLSKKNYVMKSTMMVMDLLAHFNWQRPVYYVTGHHDDAMGMENYFQLEGFGFRLVPINSSSANNYIDYGRVNTKRLYDNLMNIYRWGRMDAPDVYLDYYTRRTISIIKIRNLFSRLAMALVEEGKKDSAIAVIDKSIALLPKEKMPYSIFTVSQIEAYFAAGANEKADSLARDYASELKDEMNYYFSFPREMSGTLDYQKKVSLQILQQIALTCKKYNKDLGKELENEVNKYYSIYLQSAGGPRN